MGPICGKYRWTLDNITNNPYMQRVDTADHMLWAAVPPLFLVTTYQSLSPPTVKSALFLVSVSCTFKYLALIYFLRIYLFILVVCYALSVRQSVCRSVGPSVGPSVRRSHIIFVYFLRFLVPLFLPFASSFCMIAPVKMLSCPISLLPLPIRTRFR